MRKSLWSALLAVGLTAVSACSTSPSSPSVSFATPVAATPANGTSFKYRAQPITVTVNNAAQTGSSAATYTVEVATDAGFSAKVFTSAAIAEGASGTTNVPLSVLPGSKTYYWRSIATIDGVVGQPSAALSFVVQPQIVINAPETVSPAAGTSAGARPVFTVKNASRSGPVGPITYEFQVSSASSFGTIVASGTVAEQSGNTTWSPTSDLPAGAAFWRVRALDATNGESSPFSEIPAFTVVPFSLATSVIWNNPGDVGNWGETAKITSVYFGNGKVEVDFDRRDGPGRWPDTFTPGWSGPLQYTLGMCLFIQQQWHCSAAIQFWHGRPLTEGGDVDGIGRDWYFDQRWGTMMGYQPRYGEIVGIWVGAGNLRDSGVSTVKERSNVLFIPYGTNYTK